jgi:hypothetical protein
MVTPTAIGASVGARCSPSPAAEQRSRNLLGLARDDERALAACGIVSLIDTTRTQQSKIFLASARMLKIGLNRAWRI